MGSAIESEFAAAVVPEIKALFGQAASYAKPTASPRVDVASLTVVLDEQPGLIEVDGRMIQGRRSAVALAAQSDLETPEVRGAFTIGSEIWTISGVPLLAGGMWSCAVELISAEGRGERIKN